MEINMKVGISQAAQNKRRHMSLPEVAANLKRHKYAYLMAVPMLLFYILFSYVPMYGAIIAFKDFSPNLGILGSPWTAQGGLKHFINFFSDPYFKRILGNTLAISFLDLIFNFTAPIIFALLLNEVRQKFVKNTIQTIAYFPYFISIVVVCGIVKDFVLSEGLVVNIMVMFGAERQSLLQDPKYFRTIYIVSEIWKTFGWSSIIYLAALTGIDPQLYEASLIDGAGRWKQTIHITLPGISLTIVMLLILKIGSMLNVGFEKIILLYGPSNYETSDVISTYTYRKGLQEFNWSYSSAVGLFNSVINFIFLISANMLSKKLTNSSLW